MARRRLVSIGAALGILLAGAAAWAAPDAPAAAAANATAAPAATAAHDGAAAERWTAAPLSQLGLDGWTRRKWRAPSLTLRYRTRVARLATAARRRRVLAPAPRDGITGLAVQLNGVHVATLPASALRPDAPPRELAIDPRLVTVDNDLTLTLLGPAAAGCVAAGRWALVSPDAALELQEAPLGGPADRRVLPLPFVDPQVSSPAEVPFVLAAAPSPAALRAAFVLAGGFALAARARPSFPVHLGALPPGDAVVVVAPEAGRALGLGGGPAVRLIANPRGGRLLVVEAADAALPDLAARLAAKLAGPPRAALSPGRVVSFASLVPREQLVLHGRRDGQIRVPFALPPATVFWPNPGLPVTLRYEESVARAAPPSRLVVSVNGHFVTILKRAWSVHAPGQREARFRVPQPFLQRHNELVVSWELDPTLACPARHPEESFSVAGDSTLDLRGATELAMLPDLGQLGRSGFPFTRVPGLGATTVVVPRAPAPATVASLLALGAELARLDGRPGTGAAFLTADALPPGLDRDLIVVGTAREQPLLSRWRDRLPARIDAGAVRLRRRGVVARLRDRSERALVEAPPGHPLRAGLLTSFESPLAARRTVLVLTASDAGAMPDPALVTRGGALDGTRADVALVVDGKLQLEDDGVRYAVGHLGAVQRALWYLSLRPYLLVLLLLFGVAWLARAAFWAAALRARRRLTLPLVLVAAAAAARPARAEAPTPARLAARAHFWEARERCDKAIEIWQQLLRLWPGDAQARRGIDRCRAQAAAPAGDDATGRGVAAARALAAAGKYDAAVAAYRQALGERPPDRFALEYYETLAGTKGGRAEALASLASLASRHGGAPRFALAHARALTYDEATRRDGIARLELLSRNATVGAQATRAWRQALLWLDARPADRPLYARYLAAHPDDRALAARRDAVAHGNAVGDALALGYARLHGSAVEDAASAFTRVLSLSPHDARALAGLSWVRLKQSRFAEARALAERARALAPERTALWQPPLRAVALWSALAAAEEATRRGDWDAAEAALTRAAAASPHDAGLVAVRRGELLLAKGDPAAAERVLRPLSGAPGRDALPSLVEALLRQGKVDEADQLERARLAELDADDPLWRGLRIAVARARARAATARGDAAAAIARLREALALDPHDRDTRLQLVYAELDAQASDTAAALGEALRAEHPGDPDVATALAVAEEQAGRPDRALQTLRDIDAARLPESGRALAHRLAFTARVRAALADHHGGAGALRRRLGDLEHEAEAALDPDLQAAVAAAWWQAGEPDRALAAVRRVLSSAPTRGARLRCAGVLYDAGHDDELDRLLEDLDAEPDLTAGERRQIAELRTAELVRRVDADRREGDYRHGFLRLEPALQARPDEPSLLAALARLEAAAGHPARALAIYQRLALHDPSDLGFTEGAAFAALASGERDRARQLAADALVHHASDPRAYLLAGRIAVARGDDHAGYRLFQLGLERWHGAPGATHAAASAADPATASSLALVAAARRELVGDTADGDTRGGGDESPPPTDAALRAELAHLDERYAPTASADVAFRFRSGDPGLSRLFELEMPLSLQLSPRHAGRLTFSGTPVYLSSEATDLSDPAIADGFGTDGIHADTTLPRRLGNQNWGFGAALRYDYRGLVAELGSTPIGFRVLDVIGQAGWQGQIGAWRFGARGFRAAVTDSVLAYAGLRDPRTGIVWGGVRREGGEVHAAYDPGRYVIDGFASYAAFTGKRVAGNHGGQYGLSGLWRVLRRPRQNAALGLDLFVMNHARNLRYFTLGQGGYFSPQFFLSVGVPVRWEVRSDEWTLQVGGEAGANWYTEDAAPLYPADGALQAARAAHPELGLTMHGAAFPAVERVGPYAKVRIGAQRELGHHFVLDGNFDAQFAPAYSEVRLLLALRKAFL